MARGGGGAGGADGREGGAPWPSHYLAVVVRLEFDEVANQRSHLVQVILILEYLGGQK